MKEERREGKEERKKEGNKQRIKERKTVWKGRKDEYEKEKKIKGMKIKRKNELNK